MQLNGVSRIVLHDGTVITGLETVDVPDPHTMRYQRRMMLNPNTVFLAWPLLGFISGITSMLWIGYHNQPVSEADTRLSVLIFAVTVISGLLVGFQHRAIQTRRIIREDRRVGALRTAEVAKAGAR